MSPLELQARLAPNLTPDSLSLWPPATGWTLLVSLLLLVGLGWLAWYSWHTPWWRRPALRRMQRAYLQALNRLATDAEPELAAGHWLRSLARDGQGVPTQLPPTAFLHTWRQLSPAPLPPVVDQLLRDIYRGRDVTLLLTTHHAELEHLCLNCLHLHSPGLG